MLKPFRNSMGIVRAKNALLAAAFLLAGSRAAQALDLQAARSSPTDLAVSGLLAGVPAGETRYLPWAELRGLPTRHLRLRDEFIPGEQDVTVVFLAELWRALRPAPDADVLLAVCDDGYAAVYRQDFIARYRPFLVLEINGQGPDHWPPPGLRFNPGPYAITVSPGVVPAVADFLDVNHKKPWGVVALTMARAADAFHDAYAGRWQQLSPRAAAGREIWINSCASCHAGPGTTFGGTKSGQPFAVLAAVAQANPDFFRGYVRHPQALVPGAKMEAHPLYTDAQLAALIAFITAEAP
jgi:cytochrome c2